jgi:hypothetical protein
VGGQKESNPQETEKEKKSLKGLGRWCQEGFEVEAFQGECFGAVEMSDQNTKEICLLYLVTNSLLVILAIGVSAKWN